MKRSGRRRVDRDRVEAARRQAALALGRDPDQRDPFIEPPKASSHALPTTSASERLPVESRGIGVLSIGEAATRLGMSRSQLKAMIDRGLVEPLPTEYTRMIPTAEVERLQRARTDGA